jgi:transcriptional regulator with XRE-family HTH domain
MVRKRSEIPEQIGRQLRILREERGLTQEVVGERAGYSGKYVSEIERGLRDPAVTTLERLVEHGVGSSLQDLFGALASPHAAPAIKDRRRLRLQQAIRSLTERVLALPIDVATRVVTVMEGVVDLARRK